MIISKIFRVQMRFSTCASWLPDDPHRLLSGEPGLLWKINNTILIHRYNYFITFAHALISRGSSTTNPDLRSFYYRSTDRTIGSPTKTADRLALGFCDEIRIGIFVTGIFDSYGGTVIERSR